MFVVAELASPVEVIPSEIPGDLSSWVRDYCKNGGSGNLRVNGSVTPVEFAFEADPSADIALHELALMLSTDNFQVRGDKFADEAALTNGILVQVVVGGVTSTLATLKISEHLAELASPGGFQVVSLAKDLVVSALRFGGKVVLQAGTADKVKVTVRDNLTAASYRYFAAVVKGIKGA